VTTVEMLITEIWKQETQCV